MSHVPSWAPKYNSPDLFKGHVSKWLFVAWRNGHASIGYLIQDRQRTGYKWMFVGGTITLPCDYVA